MPERVRLSEGSLLNLPAGSVLSVQGPLSGVALAISPRMLELPSLWSSYAQTVQFPYESLGLRIGGLFLCCEQQNQAEQPEAVQSDLQVCGNVHHASFWSGLGASNSGSSGLGIHA